jgi:hypothetical protein
MKPTCRPLTIKQKKPENLTSLLSWWEILEHAFEGLTFVLNKSVRKGHIRI